MANRRVGIPYFGSPPNQYERRYFSDLVRAFAQFAEIVTNPGENGALFNFGGTVKITEASTAHPSGAGLVLSGGSVTVTIA